MSCGPGLFFGNSEDNEILEKRNFRQLNEPCASLNLRSPNLDPLTFKNLVKCFDGDEGSSKVWKLVEILKDDELGPLTNVINEFVLNDPSTLYKIEETYGSLSRANELKGTLAQFGEFLENDEFIVNTIAFLGEAYEAAPVDAKEQHKQKTLKAIELIAQSWNGDDFKQTLELGIDFAGSKAFQNLLKQLKLNEYTTDKKQLKRIANNLFDYLKSDHETTIDGKKFALGTDLANGIKSGVLFDILDKRAGRNADEVKDRAPELATIVETLTKNDGALLESLSSSFQALAHKPLKCMGGALPIPDVITHLILEMREVKNQQGDLSQYLLKDSRMLLSFLNPFCDLTGFDLNKQFESLGVLGQEKYYVGGTEHGFLNLMSDLIDDFYNRTMPVGQDGSGGYRVMGAYRPMYNFLEDFLADYDGVQKLKPLLVEVSKHNAWKDLILTMSLPDSKGREILRRTVEFWLEPKSELGGDSVFDTLVKTPFRNGSPDLKRAFRNLFLSAQKFLSGEGNIDEKHLEKLLVGFRTALDINNVHPFLDITKNIVSHTNHNKALIDTLFRVSKNHKERLREAIRSISESAKSGKLNGMMETVLAVFHKFAAQGKEKVEIRENVVKPYVSRRIHDFSQANLDWYRLERLGLKELGIPLECADLNVNQSFVNPQYRNQLEILKKCSGNPKTDPLFSALEFLNNQRATDKDERGFLEWQFDFVKGFFDSSRDGPGTMKFFVNNLKTATSKEGQLRGIIEAVRVITERPWLETEDNTEPELGKGTLIYPALRILQTLTADPESKQNMIAIGKFGGEILAREDFPKIIGDVRAILNPDDGTKKAIADRRSQSAKPFANSESQNDEMDCSYEDRVPDDIVDFLNRINFNAKQYPKKTKDPRKRAFEILVEIRRWVNARECDSIPVGKESHAWVVKRACQIVREAMESRSNWEFLRDKKAPQDAPEVERIRPRWMWTRDKVREHLTPLIKRTKNQALIDSQIAFLNYFTLPYGKQAEKDNPDSPHYNPDELLNWLYKRAVDYQLVTYYHFGTKDAVETSKDLPETSQSPKRRVRLVSSLDRLEILVWSGNVEPWLSWPLENPGLEFLNLVARAWDDKSLSGAVNDNKANLECSVEGGCSLLKPAIGFPDLPACAGGDYPIYEGESLANQRSSLDNQSKTNRYLRGGGLLIATGRSRDELQKRTYNISQVVSVLEENLPGEGKDPGLRVLRDAFWQYLSSTPDKSKSNLEIVFDSANLGNFRQISRLLAYGNAKRNPETGLMELNDPLLSNVFTSLIRAASTPGMKKVLVELLKNGEVEDKGKKDELLLKVLDLFLPSESNNDPRKSIQTGPTNPAKQEEIDFSNLSTIGLLGLGLPNQLQAFDPAVDDSKSHFLNEVLETIAENIPRHKDFIAFGGVEKFLQKASTTKALADGMEAVYVIDDQERKKRLNDIMKEIFEDKNGQNRVIELVFKLLGKLEEDPNSTSTVGTLMKRVEKFQNSSEVGKLNLIQQLGPILQFFEERDTDKNRDIAANLRNYLANSLKRGEIEPFLNLSLPNGGTSKEEHLAELYEKIILQLPKQAVESSDAGLKNILEMIDRTLSETRH